MSSTSQPIKLSDDQLAVIYRGAAPLHVHDRGPFLEAVAQLLRGVEIGDGAVGRAVAEAQRKYFAPPVEPNAGKYATKGAGG
jgi:hypothetical protein